MAVRLTLHGSMARACGTVMHDPRSALLALVNNGIRKVLDGFLAIARDQATL
jgi:hypothetical protein